MGKQTAKTRNASIFGLSIGTTTEAAAKAANDIIEFNGTSFNPDDNGSITLMELHYIEDLSIQPNPNRHLSEIQDGKLGTMELIITGNFKNPHTAGGIAKFQTWLINDKDDTTFVFGGFGMRYNKMTQVEVLTTETRVYVLFDFQLHDGESFQNKGHLLASFYKKGTPCAI